MKKYLLSTFAVLAALTIAGTASAAGHEGKISRYDNPYVKAHVGYGFGAGETEHGGIMGLAAGYSMNDYFSAEVMAEFRPWEKEKFRIDNAPNVKPDMWSMDAMVNVYASYPFEMLGDRLSVYAVGGLGMAYNKTDGKGDFKGKGKYDFAWNAGAGFEYALTECMSVDLGYRFTDLGDARIKNRTTKAKVKEKVRFNDIKLGLKYYF